MRHLLVIQSDTPTRTQLCERLQRDGHQVTALSDARDAAASLGAGGAILLEYGLSGQDTLQVLRALRRIDERLAIIVLMVPPEQVTAVLREGAYFCTRSPLNVDEVALLVERAPGGLRQDAAGNGGSPASEPPPALFRLPPQGIDFRELEREIVAQALELANGNQTRAATLLHMTRDQIRYRMAKFGINERAGNGQGFAESAALR